jgi:hypothetical protein
VQSAEESPMEQLKGRLEKIINSRPLRYSFMLNELSPKIGDWLMHISGVVDFQKRKTNKLIEGTHTAE